MKGIRIRLLSLLLAAVLLTGTGLPALAAADAEGGAEAVVTQENVDTADTEEEEKDEESSEAAEPEEPTEDADETPEEASEETAEEAPEEVSEETAEEAPEEVAEEALEEVAEAAEEDAQESSEQAGAEDESAAEITRIEEKLTAAEYLREGEEKSLRMRLKELRADLAAAGGPQRMLLKAPARGSEKKLINTGGVSVVPSGAAADGNYSFVLKPTRQSTVTFWSDGGFQWETSRRKNDAWKYGVLPKNGSGHAGAWVTDMGSYNGKNIDVKITYFYPDGYYVYTALHADSYAGVLDHYWSGIEYTARYELYLSDDHTKKVYINTGLKFLDLDFCQVFQFKNVDGVLENVSVRNDSYVYGFEENGIWTLISSGEGDDEDHQNLESQSVRFELSGVSTFDFTVSEHGFLNGYTNAIDETGAWTQSGLKEYYNNKSNLYASHLTDDWLEADGGSHAAFNGTGYGPWSIATPEKTVSDADEDEVTENTLSKQGEQLIYRVHQDIPNESSDAHRYASFRFTDTLPEGLTLLSQRVLCGKENVSSHFSFSADGRKLAASAKSPADWPFYGSILTWEITARADAGTEYVNAAEVSVTKKNGNTDTKKSNEVRTGFGKKTVKTSAVHGSIDPSATVNTGENLTVNYQPDKGYHLASVTVDGKAADINKHPASYSFTNITQDHEIRVVYEINTYKVVTLAEGGTIDATREGIEHGSKHTVNYQPNKGYHLASVTVDGKAADIKKHPSSYTFSDITQDHEIRAAFEPNTYRVSTQAVHGSIDPAKEGIAHGADHTVNYKPDAGYHLVSVTVDGKAVDIKKYPSAYAFTNITQDHEIRVVYEINTYRITTGVLNGSIDPGKEAVPHGSTEKVAYRPDEGFFISEILVNGEQADPKKIPESYTFANITADQSIRVICTPLPKKEVLNAKGESLDGKTAGRGEAVTYRITVCNAGTLARSVTVTDTVPDEMEFVSAEGGTLKDRTVTWTDVSVPAGGFRELTFTAKSLVSGRAYENAAQVSYGSGTYTTNTVRHYVLPDPVKTVAQGGRDAAGATLFREAGQENNILTYAITWKNISAEEREFTVTDPLPRGAVFVSADHGGSYENGAVVWKGSVPAGGEIRLTASVRLPAAAKETIFRNKAHLVSHAYSGDTQEVVNYLARRPIKRVLNESGKEIDGEIICANDLLIYEIEVENPRDDETEFTITDTLREGLAVQEISDAGSAKGQTVSWKIRIAPGGRKTVRVSAKAGYAIAGEKVTNKAVVSGDGYDAETNEVTNYVLKDPEKMVGKAKGPDTDSSGRLAAAGEELIYSITVRNPADVEKAFEILDVLPDGAEFVSADNEGACRDYAVKWTVTIPPHGEKTVRARVRIDAAAKGTRMKNKAQISVDSIENETNEVETPVPEDPKKTVRDAAGNDADGKTVDPGSLLRYGIRFRNPGKEAKTFVITDKVPQHLIPDRIGEGGILKDGVITWSCALAPGEEKEVTFTASVKEKGVAFDNSAEMTAEDVTIPSNTTRNGVPADPVKKVLSTDGKEIDGRVRRAADLLTYTITASNPMTVEKRAVLTDVLPKGAVFREADCGGTCSAGTVTWNLTFAPGETKTVRVSVSIADTAKDTVLQNRAAIRFDNTAQTGQVTTPVAGDPVKRVLSDKGKDLDGQVVSDGQELTYAVTFRNPSSQEKVFSVTDILPENTEFVRASDGGRVSNGRVIFEARLKGGETRTVSFAAKVKGKGCVIRNSAIVMVDDVQTRTNEVVNAVPLDPVKKTADLKGRDIDHRGIAPGTEYYYIICAANPFDSEKSFTLTDTLPEGTAFVEATDAPAIDGRKLTFTLRMKANERREIRIRVKAQEKAAGKALVNRALMTADGWKQETNEVTNYIAQAPIKEVVNSEGKDRNGKDAKINAELTYRITVSSPKGAKEAVYTIRDYYPADKLEVLSVEDKGEDGADGNNKRRVYWEIPLKGGEKKTVSFRVRVRNAAESEIRNRAEVTVNDTVLYTNTVTNEPVRADEEEREDEPQKPASGETQAPHIPTVAAAERSGSAASGTGDRARMLLYGGICAAAGALLIAFAFSGRHPGSKRKK